jgi:hypothetical protein
MENTVLDCVKYLFLHYPYHGELSKARVVKMIYLADWRSCLVRGCQITPIRWYFNHYGPYVSEIIDSIRNDQDFLIQSVTNMFGDSKELIILRNKQCEINISDEVSGILDYVISNTSNLSWDQFISLVYSTYPIVSQSRYSYLDLVQLSTEYKSVVSKGKN